MGNKTHDTGPYQCVREGCDTRGIQPWILVRSSPDSDEAAVLPAAAVLILAPVHGHVVLRSIVSHTSRVPATIFCASDRAYTETCTSNLKTAGQQPGFGAISSSLLGRYVKQRPSGRWHRSKPSQALSITGLGVSLRRGEGESSRGSMVGLPGRGYTSHYLLAV